MKNVSPQKEKVVMGRKLFLMTYRKWLNETQKLPRAEVPLPLLLCDTQRWLRGVCIQCSCRPMTETGLTLRRKLSPYRAFISNDGKLRG